MATKESTGLRNHMATAGSFVDAMGECEIRVFSGSEPATADAAETGTLLYVATTDGDGSPLEFEAVASNGVLPKKAGDVWSGECLVTGTPGYYRLCRQSDDGTLSTTAQRIQGTCGQGGADLNFSTATLTATETYVVNNYQYVIPTL